MSTTTAQYQDNLATARTTYANAVTALVAAIIDLEALTLTVNNITREATHVGKFGGASAYWPDLHRALEHPIAAPLAAHASLKNMDIARDVKSSLNTYLAQWSGN